MSQMLNSQELLWVLQVGVPHREVYHAQNGSWCVTYGGERTNEAAVRSLISAGYIVPVYSDPKAESWHIGQTIDIAATLERRKAIGKHAQPVYTQP